MTEGLSDDRQRLIQMERHQKLYESNIRDLHKRIKELEDELNRESYRRNELISLICEVAGCGVEDIGLKWVDMQMDRDVWSKVLKVSHYPRPDSDGGL